jgi:RNase P/RNase MRP subunit p29
MEKRNIKEKQIKIPVPEHPISIQHNPARVVVSVAGRVIAETRNALTLRESDYSPVQYIPSEDVDFRSWKGPSTRPTVRTKAIAITTAFLLEGGNPSTPCGRTRIRILLLRRSKDTSRSIPIEPTR